MPRTFYIDPLGGSDSNNGTSTSTPWKHGPKGWGWTGSGYAHQIGDRFIYKGGTTMVRLGVTIDQGGNSANWDYYGGGEIGVDAVGHTWFNGASWTKPKFDCQNSLTNLVQINANYVKFDNFEFTGFHWGAQQYAFPIFYIDAGISAAWKVTNCYFHGWTHDNGLAPSQVFYDAFVCVHQNTNMRVTDGTSGVYDCVFEGAGNHGYAVNFCPNVIRCKISGVTNAAILGGVPFGGTVSVTDCDISTVNTYDGQTHGNQVENISYAHVKILRNTFHDTNPAVNILVGPPFIDQNNDGVADIVHPVTNVYYYNNVSYKVNTANGLSLDTRGGPVNAYVYNNTIVQDGFNGGVYVRYGTEHTAQVFAANNHVIGGATWGGDHHLNQTMAQANAAGYTEANRYRPTSSGSPTVGQGTNLSSVFTDEITGGTRTIPWDIGAYEYGVSDVGGGGDTTPPTVSVTAPGNGATVSGTITVTAAASDNVAVASVQFYVDNVLFATDTSSPYSVSLDTTTLANGSRVIKATATDTSGNTTSATVTMTVNNVTPVLQVTPGLIAFPVIQANTTTADLDIVVKNNGTGTLTDSGITSSDSSVTIFSGSGYSLAAGAQATVKVRWRPTAKMNLSATLTFNSNGGSKTVSVTGSAYPVVGTTFNADDALITAPAVANVDHSASQPTQQTLGTSGVLRAGVTITTPGDYNISTLVNAPNDASNSFWANVDAEPTDPSMIWDVVQLTSGFETRVVSWRGSGAFDAPEFPNKVFTLSAGVHQLILRFREPTSIKTITFTPVAPLPLNQPPGSTISGDVSSGIGPLPVTFTLGSTDSDGTVTQGVLDFGDGSSTVTVSSPGPSITRSHTYGSVLSNTTYTATWTVTDNSGAQTTSSFNVLVTPPPPPPNQPPTCGLTSDVSSGVGPLDVVFTLTSADSDGTIATGTLDYGDGSSPVVISSPGSPITRSHTYASVLAETTYTATWRVTDNSEAQSSIASRNITVSPTPPPLPNQPPVPTISADVTTGTGPLAVTFTLGSSDPDGTVASGILDFGDGSSTVSVTSPGSSITRSHTYGSVVTAQNYTATWTITDNLGLSASATVHIIVSPPPPPPNQAPLAGISASPLAGSSPLHVNFTLTSSDADGTVVSGVIDYGDGSPTETISNPAASVSRSHDYQTGDFTATWKVTDDDAAMSAIASVAITVLDPSQVPAILYVP